MRVRFLRNYEYRPTPRILVCYKAGTEQTVKREAGEKAVAEGAAVCVADVRRLPPPPAGLVAKIVSEKARPRRTAKRRRKAK